MEEDQDKIEDLKKVLNSRNSKLPDTLLLNLKEHKEDVPENWEAEKIEVRDPEEPAPKKSVSLIILMIASVFFVGAVFFAGYIYFKGDNIISADNIAIDVAGPLTVGAGEVLALDVAITNNNDTPLILADLLVEYPEGTRNGEDKISELPRERIPVGTIEAHQTVRKTLKALLFDEEGQKPMIKYSLEYRLENSGSVFTYDGAYEVTIGSSPVTMNVEMLKEVNADQELVIDIAIASNSEEIVKGLLLNAEFPPGFEMKSATPEPFQKKTVWNLGDIEPEGKRNIKIRGTMIGGSGEEKTFKFSIGGQSEESEVRIDKPFMNLAKSVMIKKPFLGIDLFVDGGLQSNQLAKAGAMIQSKIAFENNLSVPITDAVIEVKLTGAMIDKKTVEPVQGFYRSNSDTVRWTKFEMERLESLVPGRKGEVYLNYSLFAPFSKEASGLKNQEILADVTISGKRLSENNVPETIQSTVKRRIRVETLAKFNAEVKHKSGPFQNAGVYPPQVDQKTEYTVTWTVSNSLNDIEGARVKATLPSYVVWTGKTSPTSEKMVYDPDSRQITWEIGKVFSGGGTAGSLRQVSFQVALTPSLQQLREIPDIVNVATFTARDTFTGTDISVSAKPVTTAASGDPGYTFGDESVRE